MSSLNGSTRRERKIRVRGAREHNLKNLNLEMPREKLIVITGLSGSGKSSLAFDTLYGEGQRRYVESLSAYARQFIDQIGKPDVDSIEGLSPTIAIEQKTVSKNPRSTVGTVTETYDHLRLLYARLGLPHCPSCGQSMNALNVEQMVSRAMGLGPGKKLEILAPIVRGRKGIYRRELEDLERKGYLRVRVDGDFFRLGEDIPLKRHMTHNIEAAVDHVVLRSGVERRLGESIQAALGLARGLVILLGDDGAEYLFSEECACARCGVTVPEMAPRMFSFNSPYGSCPECDGLGVVRRMDEAKIVPDPHCTLDEGAIVPLAGKRGFLVSAVRAFMKAEKIPGDRPYAKLSKRHKKLLLYGKGRARERAFPGIVPALAERAENTASGGHRAELEKYMSGMPCQACGGGRLKPESLAVTYGGKSIADVAAMSVKDARAFFEGQNRADGNDPVAERILGEILSRLEFLENVGLNYLTLDRPSATLAGGEGQRIRLASQMGTSLVGVLYVLDEPSIGLHQRDNRRLLDTLRRLRDMGNTIIVVEHDRETIESADYVLDLGPGAGESGGYLVACGAPDDIRSTPGSLTGRYLTGAVEISPPIRRRVSNDQRILIRGARQHNLKNVDVGFPLGLLICVTGVSGSGKSTLVDEILYRALSRRIYRSLAAPGAHESIEGADLVDKVIAIDQSPIGRTPRSNPATYAGVFSPIRSLFAQVPEARKRGYAPGRFSFNVRGGRCETCQGDGYIRLEMHFLPDLFVCCSECLGRRFNRDTLDVRYKGRNVAETLEMTVDEALAFFENINTVRWKMKTLQDVGLGYLRLGQSATTLSGGEAQRIKLARELAKRATGRTVYILDEPTTGLHFADIENLLGVLHRLVEEGNTVVVIEHNLDVIKSADHIIDLGPGGGEEGGYLIAEGPPERIAEIEASATGVSLREALNGVPSG